jgi:hypothetical protein
MGREERELENTTTIAQTMASFSLKSLTKAA